MEVQFPQPPPDFSQLRGKTTNQATKFLRAAGYKTMGKGHTILMSPDGTHMVRLSRAVALGEAFAEACRRHEDNIHLPRVFAHAALSKRSHITLMEPLTPFSAYTERCARVTMRGQARAIAAFMVGDDMHAVMHSLLRTEPGPAQAVRIALSAALRATRKGESIFVNPCPNAVMFRVLADGKCVPVYASPFETRKDAVKVGDRALQWMEQRFSNKELHNPTSKFWQGRPPIPMV